MVIVDGILVSEDLFKAQFVCDLSKCKGGCCVEGDAGAPLTDGEAAKLEEGYQNIKHLLPKAHREKIETDGFYTYHSKFGKVTPTLDSGICTYAYYDKNGIVKCGLEKEYKAGNSNVPKPVSCHLFPIRVCENGPFVSLNYAPRPGLCDPACTLGKSLKIPVYKFLKEAIVRRFGQNFYTSLERKAAEFWG